MGNPFWDFWWDWRRSASMGTWPGVTVKGTCGCSGSGGRKGGAARRPPHSPFLAAAAQAVVADYDLSQGRGHRDPVSAETGRSAAPAPPARSEFRVVPCARVIDQPGGRLALYYVAFTGHATTIRTDLLLDEPPPRQPHPDPLPAWARQLSVTDSRGTTAEAVFFGSGRIGGSVWHGQYETHPRLAADTAWIELLESDWS